MTIADERPDSAKLMPRIKNLLLRPVREWEAIDAEPVTIRGLYLRYVLLLAAIGPVCQLIGGVVFGYRFGALKFPANPVSAVIGAGVSYLLNLALVLGFALIIDALATSFGGQANRVQAFKVAAYSATAYWLAGVFNLVPHLSILAIVGLYSVYLLHTGLPRLMKAPARKANAYVGVVIAIAIIMALVTSLISNGIARIALVPPPGVSASGRLRLPGVDIDVKRLEEAAREAERQVKAAQQGAPALPAATGEELQTLLPPSIKGGFVQSAIENSTGAGGPVVLASAKARYDRDDARIELEISDLGSVGALAAAFNVRVSKETDSGYQKVTTEAGRTITEEYDRKTRRGRYLVIVGGRYAVQAQGRNVTVGDLKAGVAAIDFERLEAMAKG